MRTANVALMTLGAFLMLMALFYQIIDIASNDYRIILLLALACIVLANVCFAVVIYRGDAGLSAIRGGNIALRYFAVMMASPSLFIIGDLFRRAPHTFTK